MISDQAIREFLLESHEGLDLLDREFVALEENPAARERIANIFRIIHTVKGTAGFLGYSKLETIAHAGESLLSPLRDGTLKLTPAMTSALLEMVDRVRSQLKAVESDGKESAESYGDLLARLAALREPSELATSPPAEARVAAPVSAESAASAQGAAAPSPPPAPAAAPAETSSSAIAESNVRIDVAILDRLMNLVGELVLARNQVLQIGSRIEDAAFANAAQRLSLITSELQEQVMRTRMQPIGSVWSKLPRVVRDLAVACGKQVRVEMTGKDTELDRTILEAIKDPLVHVVRNAVDHGIESAELRRERGKPRTGSLMLRAYHQAGQVNIEISDDGGGIDVERVRQKALERQLITREQSDRMGEHEVAQLVFQPGFSTAAKVTNISGRGVGMDVVKTNIERIGGTLDLTSRPGQGTTLRIRIPLTLAIVPALIALSGGQRFAIPQTNLLEIVRLEGEEGLRSIEDLYGAPIYRLRGNLLPLVYLGKTLKLPERPSDKDASVHIVVLQADEAKFGLIVDSVLDTEEIVVKPLGNELKSTLFAGATIMGDGRVALILDVSGLAQHAHAAAQSRDGARSRSRAAAVAADVGAEERQSLLLFTTDRPGVMALPLSMIARLEELSATQIERIGDLCVAQYRGEVMPLVSLAGPSGEAALQEPVPAIVYESGGHQVGFLVRKILDVVEDSAELDRRTAQDGVLGTSIIQGRVTEILDVEGLVRSRFPKFLSERAA